MFAGRLATRAVRSGASIAPRAAIRSYATPAAGAASQNILPPIALYGIDGTYATALYTAAAKTQGALEPTARAMETLAAVFKRDAKLQTILQAPSLSPDDKKAIVAELQKHTGGQDKGDVIKNFLLVLAEHNRLGALEPITENFGKLMSAYRGEVELIVTSAAPLDHRVLRQLEQTVSKSSTIAQGQKLKVVTKVNPDIRGGLIVEVGDRTIDLSVSAKMARMNKLLKDQL